MTMKQSLILILALTILMQAACAPTAVPVTVPATVPAAQECPVPTSGLTVLRSDEDGYCFLYPAEYSTEMPGWVVINPISAPGDVPGDAWVNIHTEDAAGRTLDQLAEEIRTTLGADFNITIEEVQLHGSPAIVVDGQPGVDSNRIVYTFRNERLYALTFMPWQPDAGQVTPLEHLYETIMQSIHFVTPTKALPTPTVAWGPDNPPPAMSFVTPQDGETLAFESDYFFQVNEIGADGYLWSFTQNGEVVWENLRDEMGYTAGGTYAIVAGSPAHDRLVPGPMQVSVRAVQGEFLSEPAVITVILQ